MENTDTDKVNKKQSNGITYEQSNGAARTIKSGESDADHKRGIISV